MQNSLSEAAAERRLIVAHRGVSGGNIPCNTLAAYQINVLDISQTIMEGYFTMMMVVDLTLCREPFDKLRAALREYGEGRALSIRIQREDIFDAMHKL